MNYCLLIYPASALVLLFANVKVVKKGEVSEDLFTLNNSKSLSVVAAFGVILHHLVQYITEFGFVSKGPITIFNKFGILFTSIFFFTSGYGLITSYLSKENYLKGFLKNRILKILFPFIEVNIIYMIYLTSKGVLIKGPVRIIKGIIGIDLYNDNAWFIVEILIFYLIFLIVFSILKNAKVAVVLMTIFCVGLFVLSASLGYQDDKVYSVLFKGEWWRNSLMTFPLGLVAGLYRKQIEKLLQKAIIYVTFTAVSVLVFLFAFRFYNRGSIVQNLICISFVVALVLLFYRLKTGNIVLSLLAPLSLYMYLLHDLFLKIPGDIAKMMDMAVFAVVLAGGTLLALILYLVNKYGMLLITGKLVDRDKIKKYKLGKIKYICLIAFIVALLVGGYYLYRETIGQRITIAKEMKSISQAQIGDIVEYGRLDHEAIEWIVIDVKTDKVLLISRGVLGETSYNSKHVETNYKSSDIRKLLGEYYEDIFSDKEREHIIEDSATKDYLYLLSEAEALKYFVDNRHRVVQDKSMIRNNGDVQGLWWEGKTKGPWWWLRSDKSDILAPIVFLDGEVQPEGKYVNIASGGLRPAVWIKK